MRHCAFKTGLLAMGLILSALACGAPQDKVVPFPLEQQKKLGIETIMAKAVLSYPLPPLPAEVVAAPQHHYAISLPFSVTVEDLPILPGQKVKKGDVLLRLQSPEILDLEGRRRQAQARLSEAQKRLYRVRRLAQEGVLAQKEEEMASADAASALAEEESLARTLRLADASRGKMVLRAPEDGQVLFVHAKRGKALSANDLLVTLAASAPPWLEILVPAALVSQIYPGMEALAQGQKGTLRGMGGIDPSTQMARAQVELANQGVLLPGVKLSALLFIPGENLFSLPRSSLTEQGGKSFVFVQREEGFLPVEVLRLGELDDSIVVKGDLLGSKVTFKGTAAIKAAWGGE